MGDWRQLVGIAEKHVEEKIDRLTAKYEQSGKEQIADTLDAIRTDMLPELTARLRSRH